MKCDVIIWNVCPGIYRLGHLDKMIMTATPFKPMSLFFLQTKNVLLNSIIASGFCHL